MAKADDGFGLEQGNDYGAGYTREREGKGLDAHGEHVDVQSGLGGELDGDGFRRWERRCRGGRRLDLDAVMASGSRSLA